MKQTNSSKLTFFNKVGYSSAAVGDAAFYTMVGSFLLFYLTTVAGIHPALAGTITAIGAIWSTVFSPVVGYISDHSKTKYGRRLPFMFIGCIPAGVFTLLLFTCVPGSQAFKAVFYILMIILFWSSYTTFFNPFFALGAEITDDYNERTSVRSYAYVFNICGMTFGMIAPPAVVDLLETFGCSTELAWFFMAACLSILSIASIVFTVFYMIKHGFYEDNREEPGPVPDSAETEAPKESRGSLFARIKPILTDYIQVLKLKPLVWLLLTGFCYLCVNTIVGSDRIYFMTYNLGMTGTEITAVLLTIIVCGVIYVPIINKISSKLDKRSAYLLMAFLGTILMVSAKFLTIETKLGMIAFLAVYTISNTAYWQLVPAMVYDVCEVDEYYNNTRREGVISSMQSIVEALSTAVSMQVLGIILDFAGFDGDLAVQSPTALLWIENSMILIGAVFLGISFLTMYRYPITRKKFKEIMDALEQRRGSKSI